MHSRIIKPKLSKFQQSISGTFLLLLLCIILILVPCMSITAYANHLISEKIRSANENFLLAASSSIDSSIQAVVDQTDIIIETNSSDYYKLLRAGSMSGSDATLSSYHLYNALHKSQFAPDYFDTVILYFKNPGIVLTTSGSYDARTFFGKKYIFSGYPSDYFDSLMGKTFRSIPCPSTSILTQDVHGKERISSESVIPFAVHPVSSSGSDALFLFLMDETTLNKTLSYFNPNQSCYIYLMDTVTGTILNHSSDTDYASLLNLSQQDYAGSSGSMTLKASSGNCRVLWCTSSVSKLRYICVEPRLLITQQLHAFLFLTAFITLATILILILGHKVFARWLQNGFSSIFHRLTQASGVNDYPPATKTIDITSLRNAVDLLCTQYENNRPHLIVSFLTRLLQDNATDREIMDFCKDFNVFQPKDYFSIFIIRTNFRSCDESLCSDAQAHSEILAGLRQDLEKYGYVILLRDGTDCLLFLTAPAMSELENIRNRFIHDFNEITYRLPEFICGQSIDYHDIRETYRCYHQVLTLLEYHGIASEKPIYTMEDLLSTSECRLSPKEKEKIQALSRHASDECLAYIRSLMTSWKSQNVSLNQYRNIILELLFLLQQILYEAAIPFSTVFHDSEDDLFDRLEQSLISSCFDKICLDSYQQMFRVMQRRNTSVSQAEQTLLHYIDEHLADINLTMLADVTGMNQNYLSQYFKKHYGVTFLDYITRKKIEKAKLLLVNSSLTCKAIGESLGYHDPNVFIRTFKKLEATTPNEYRQMHRKQQL